MGNTVSASGPPAMKIEEVKFEQITTASGGVTSAHYDALPKNSTPSETYAAILLDFFDGIDLNVNGDHTTPSPPGNDALMDVVKAELLMHHEAGDLPLPDYKSCLRILPHASSFACEPYSTVSLEVQIFIAKFTMFFIHVDDKVNTSPTTHLPDLREFPSLMAGTLSPAELALTDPVLRLAAKNLRENTRTHYSAYNTGIIFKSSLDFTMGCIIEAINNLRESSGRPIVGEDYEPHDTMLFMKTYTRFMRLKTALSEAFATLLFPLSVFPDEETSLPSVIPIIPMMVDFIDHVNDILSYYKETVVGTEKTYFTTLEKMTGTERMMLLKAECETQVAMVLGVRRLLESEEKEKVLLRGLFDGFVDRYIRWHNNCDRYRLGEIGIGEYHAMIITAGKK